MLEPATFRIYSNLIFDILNAVEPKVESTDLIRLFTKLTKPLEHKPTDTASQLPSVPAPIKAVLFDVYGTLISSGVGDISLDQTANEDRLIHELIAKHGYEINSPEEAENLAASINREIQIEHDQSRASGAPYPEVDIREIWARVLSQRTKPHPSPREESQRIEHLAVEYECAVNPVWPNPGFAEILEFCRERKIPMGIVSNAQFYTPIMLESFLGQSLTSAGFESSLMVWSYLERRGKPDTSLYQKMAQKLRSNFGIQPHEALFVGNDMLKDIWAATEVGFKGVLYAGDERSLRLRKDDSRCQDLQAYAIISSLLEIRQLLPFSE